MGSVQRVAISCERNLFSFLKLACEKPAEMLSRHGRVFTVKRRTLKGTV